MSDDVISAVIELLKADSNVAALVGARVFGDELPKHEVRKMPRNVIVIRPSGGVSLTGGSYVEHDAQRIDILGYGRSPFEANEVRRAGSKALRSTRRSVWSNVLIHWINSAGGFATARDPDADWPFSFQSFQVFHALEEV